MTEGLLGTWDICGLARPRFLGGCLEPPAVGEAELPRSAFGGGPLVDGIEIHGSFIVTLATR